MTNQHHIFRTRIPNRVFNSQFHNNVNFTVHLTFNLHSFSNSLIFLKAPLLIRLIRVNLTIKPYTLMHPNSNLYSHFTRHHQRPSIQITTVLSTASLHHISSLQFNKLHNFSNP